MKPKIDTTKPVLVTGATGYVAGWLVKRLLEDGITVHAAVRDSSNSEKLKYLDRLAESHPGKIRYFESDLLKTGSYGEAMSDCELVYHTASPFTLSVDDPKRDLVEPAQLGTRNVLNQANETPNVKRVVVTSSCAAIYGDNIDLQHGKPGKRLTERDWNTTSSLQHQPYSYSKTLAEQEAWKISQSQDRWDLVTINPSLVIGPGINPFATSESFSLMKQFGDGTFKQGVPDYGIGVVDVRDVAEAHLEAGFNPAAHGRYITSGHNTSFPEIGQRLQQLFGNQYPFPKRVTPKWLVWLVAPMLDKTMTRKMISKNVGYDFNADNSKSVHELGIDYYSLDVSLREMFQQLLDHDIIDQPVSATAELATSS